MANKINTHNEDSNDFITFVVHTAKYKTLANKMFLNRKKWVKDDPNNILSKIPGSIKKIYVKENQKVKKGEILLELDAMKMYNRILAPFAATVKKIHVKDNQSVSKNVLLIELR